MRQHYTEEEANAILRKAVERQPMGDEMSREQLESIAGELGITPEALTVAETEWREEQHEQSLRAAFEAERRAAFWERAPRYVGGNIFLIIFLLMTVRGGGVSPATTMILLFMALLAGKTVMRGVSAYQRGPAQDSLFQKWVEERERAALPHHIAGETYATPEPSRRMRRRIMR